MEFLPTGRRPHNRDVETCIRGHPLCGDNLYVANRATGYLYRRCRECDRLRKQRERQQAAARIGR